MTIAEIKESKNLFLLAEEISEVLQVGPQSIRAQAQMDPKKLGFPIIVVGTRIKIPRKPFLAYLGEEA